MKKPITKRKVSMTMDVEVYNFLNQFENKSKYIEYLIYKYLKENGLLDKDVIL
jgi:tRNA splicing endonuclease